MKSRIIPEMGGFSAKKAFDYLIVGIAGASFLIAPLFFTGLVAQGIGFEKLALFYFFVLIGLVVWAIKGVVEGKLDLKHTPLDWFILGVLGSFIISTTMSVSLRDSLFGPFGAPIKGLIGLLALILFFYFLLNNLTQKTAKAYYWLLFSSFGLILLYSTLQLLSLFVLPAGFTHANGFNPLDSISALSMLAAISLPLLLVSIGQLENIQPNLSERAQLLIKSGLSILLVLAVFVLLMLNGFTFWWGALTGVVIVLMFLLAKIVKSKNNQLILPVAIFIILIMQIVLGNFGLLDMVKQSQWAQKTRLAAPLPTEISLSLKSSYQLAKSSLAKDPIFGSGPGTFGYSFSRYKQADFNYTPLWSVRFDSGTGSLFELLATVGALGGLAFLAFLFTALTIAFIALVKTSSQSLQPILLGLVSALVVGVLHFFFTPMTVSAVFIVGLLGILTLAIAFEAHADSTKKFSLSFRSSPNYALALAALVLAINAAVGVLFTMGFKYLLADYYAQKSFVNADQNQKIAYLGRAITLAPSQYAYYLELAKQHLAAANQLAVQGGDRQLVANHLALSISAGRQAMTIVPNSANATESLALIYENVSFFDQGALSFAEELYKKLASLEPTSPVPYLRLGLINVARANNATADEEKTKLLDEAIKLYGQALEKKTDFIDAYYAKSVAFEKENKLNEAIDQLKLAVAVSNGNQGYRFELGRLLFNRGVSQPLLAQPADPEAVSQGTDNPTITLAPDQTVKSATKKNDDLTAAETLFASVIAENPNHANALYALALLYQKVGENDNAKKVVAKLLTVVPDEASKEAVKKQFAGLY